MLYCVDRFYYSQKAQKAQKEYLTAVFVQLMAKTPCENVQKGAERAFKSAERAQKAIFQISKQAQKALFKFWKQRRKSFLATRLARYSLASIDRQSTV